MGENTNALVAQYLSGLGADLMKYGGDTTGGLQFTNMNKVTNENVKSNSMAKLIESALGPDSSKMTIDSKGVTLNASNDSELFKQMLEGSGIKPPSIPTESPAATTTTPAAAPTPVSNVASQPDPNAIPNPFMPPSIRPIDMKSIQTAGLSPQEIASVIGMKQSQDQLRQQSYRDVVDSIYKGALTKQAIAATNENTPSVDIKVGDRDMKVTPKDAIAWEKLKKETTPNEIKLYQYAQDQGFKGSIIDFKNSDTTGHMKDYDKAKDDPGFKAWMLEQAKAGAVNLGDKIEEKKKMSELEGQFYFDDPKWTNDLNKRVDEFNKDQAWLLPEKDRPLALAKVKVKAIEDKIAAGGGAIQSVVMNPDGKNMEWTVKWPSGDTKKIKQAVK